MKAIFILFDRHDNASQVGFDFSTEEEYSAAVKAYTSKAHKLKDCSVEVLRLDEKQQPR